MNLVALPKGLGAASGELTPSDSSTKQTFPMTVTKISHTAEPNHTRFKVGGDRINYPGEVATPTAKMLTAKLLFNSVISTSGAKFMTMDNSNFYLMTPLPHQEYLRLKLSDIPKEIIDESPTRPGQTGWDHLCPCPTWHVRTSTGGAPCQ
eukprot:CCRYP_015426-RA/>CCRYP_015426-RA protein AED:0.44 eAED:0.58 QI:0/0/0/1/0/0/2/0/149